MEPTRYVSWITRLRVLSGGAGVHFASIVFWLVLAIANAIVWDSELMLWGTEWQQGEAVLMTKEVFESEDDDGDISYSYEYTINYKVGEKSYSNVCHSSYDLSYKIEDTVPIEYNVSKPQFARMPKTTSMPYGTVVGVVCLVLLLLVGTLLAYFLNKNRKLLHLLEYGVLTRGTLHAAVATNTSINEQTVYEYTFKFEVDGHTHFVKGKTHLYDNVEDEEYEKILYELEHPEYAAICDISPYLPKIENSGELQKQSSLFSILGYTAITVIGSIVCYLIVV